MFYFSNYWRTWSRVIYNGEKIIEVDLTPLNSRWHKINEIVIRAHNTCPKNPYVKELPEEVREHMLKYLSEDIVNKLLTYNFLSEVSPKDIIDANRKSNGGGVPFQAIKDIRDGKLKMYINE